MYKFKEVEQYVQRCLQQVASSVFSRTLHADYRYVFSDTLHAAFISESCIDHTHCIACCT